MANLTFSVVLMIGLFGVWSQGPPTSVNPGEADGFPMQPGTYWVYRGTVKWQAGNEVRQVNIDWKMEVVQRVSIGQYDVALLKGHPDDLWWYNPGKMRGDYLLVKDGGKYYKQGPLSPQDLSTFLSDPKQLPLQLQLDSNFLDLPFQEGMCLGKDPIDREDNMYCWLMREARPIKIEGVKGVSSNQQFIEATISYYANTDHTWFKFVPGVGITSFIFGHHGSVSEAELKLVEFHLGR
jgi:hypothetical protein